MSHPKTTSSRAVQNSFESLNNGRVFEDTLIGSLLSKSCLPSLPGKPYLFYEKPKVMSERDIELTAKTMWQVRNKCSLFDTVARDNEDYISRKTATTYRWSLFII